MAGSHPFTYGYGFVSLPGRFLDLMAYHDICTATGTACQQLLAYSNPGVAHGGRRTGVAAGTNLTCTAGNVNNPECDADNARAMAEMAPVVARYRDSRTGLSARQVLPGGAIRSGSGQFRLSYQTDGNLVLIDDRNRTVLWTTNTAGTSAGQAILQADGNFVVQDAGGVVRWASGTAGNSNAYLSLQDDGNLVIHRADGEPLWDVMTLRITALSVLGR